MTPDKAGGTPMERVDAFIAKEPRIFYSNIGDREKDSIDLMRALATELQERTAEVERVDREVTAAYDLIFLYVPEAIPLHEKVLKLINMYDLQEKRASTAEQQLATVRAETAEQIKVIANGYLSEKSLPRSMQMEIREFQETLLNELNKRALPPRKGEG